ncbi:MAG: hypothetical protein NYU90_06990 [Aigarchaeota archaeon]|nr:hypothetical protein [Candidatus Calditenuis fumarioli]
MIAILVIAAALATFLRQPGPREVRIKVTEFSYQVDSGQPIITLKVGEEIRVVLENVGKHDHEFLLVRDKDVAIQTVREELAKGTPDEALDRLKSNMAVMGIRYEVEPGSLTIFRLRFTTPGTFYFVCLETEPRGVPHAELGEVGQIVVEG